MSTFIYLKEAFEECCGVDLPTVLSSLRLALGIGSSVTCLTQQALD